MADFRHVSEKQQEARYPPLNTEESSSAERMLLEAAPSSALAMHQKRRRKSTLVGQAVNSFVEQVMTCAGGPVMASIPPGALSDLF